MLRLGGLFPPRSLQKNRKKGPNRLATWYRDKDGDLWRHSKSAGGMQVETPDETRAFGEVIPFREAIETYDLEQLPYEEGLVLDEFEKIRIPQIDIARFRTLRAAVLKIVQHARDSHPPVQIEGTREETTTVQ